MARLASHFPYDAWEILAGPKYILTRFSSTHDRVTCNILHTAVGYWSLARKHFFLIDKSISSLRNWSIGFISVLGNPYSSLFCFGLFFFLWKANIQNLDAEKNYVFSFSLIWRSALFPRWFHPEPFINNRTWWVDEHFIFPVWRGPSHGRPSAASVAPLFLGSFSNALPQRWSWPSLTCQPQPLLLLRMTYTGKMLQTTLVYRKYHHAVKLQFKSMAVHGADS